MNTLEKNMKITDEKISNSCEVMEENEVSITHELTAYQKRYLPVKRVIDVLLSGSAIIVLAPILASIAIAIKIDSPGPILFKQKRVGKNKELFEIWKFRSMRTDTPKDMPTHMLNNPEVFITRTGKFLRKTSLDELPQIFNIFKGEMSIIGPRPALWNQSDLITERDKYGANDVTPGLTGWAQINGRDELEIPVKARFDGEYVKKISIGMDVKCFLGTIGSVLSSDGVVEGGTGMIHDEGENATGVVSKEKLKKEICIGTIVASVISVISIIGMWRVIFIIKKIRKERDVITNTNNKDLLKKIMIAVSGVAIVLDLYANKKRKNKRLSTIRSLNEELGVKDNFDEKKVSIIMPMYNCEKFVAESIESVLQQTYANWELLVVDDCSTDSSVEIVKSYIEKDNRIKLLINRKNSGAAVSRNYALKEANGRWIAFLDSDDLWRPEKLEKQIAFMESNNYHFSYTYYTEMDEDGNDTGVQVVGPKKITPLLMKSYNYMGCLTVMYDCKVTGLIQITNLKKRNDYALWLKISEYCTCYAVPENLAIYRVRKSGSITNRKNGTIQLIKWHYKLFRESQNQTVINASFWTGINIVCGFIKKIVYKKRIEKR